MSHSPVGSGSRKQDRLRTAYSVQRIELPDVPGAFETWGERDGLECLLDAYFYVAARSVRPLVRIRWQAGRPTLELTWLRAPLIVMGPRTTELSPNRRAISVTVEGGLLARPDLSARLTLALNRGPTHLCAQVELKNYVFRGAQWRIVRWLYGASQGRLHARAGVMFLRALRRTWPSGIPTGHHM
jgi:hypothetical protein